jgi:hypothetical protein
MTESSFAIRIVNDWVSSSSCLPGLRIAVRGRNLTDKIYTQSVSNTAGRLEPPRSVDVTLTTNFRR